MSVALFLFIVFMSAVAFAPTTVPLMVDGKGAVGVSEGNVVWAKTYGGSGDDRAFYALAVDDNTLIVGSSKSESKATVGWLIMIDSEGNMLWNQTYLNGAGTELRYAIQLSDGYLLVGNQFTQTGDVNGYIAKVNLMGVLVWERVVGGGKIDKLFSGAAVSDGFVVCGLSCSYNSVGEAAWALKLDSNGQIVWSNTYPCGAVSALRSVVAAEGGVVAAGYQSAGDGNFDFTLMEIAVDGVLRWNRSYCGGGSEKAYSMVHTSSGYIIVGDVTSPEANTDVWVLHVDSGGVSLWNRTIGGSDFDSATYITAASDGTYLVTGYTFSFGKGYRDFWLLNVNDEGDVLSCCTYGDSAYQEAYAAIAAGDGAYILIGWTDPLDRPDLVGKATYDFYVVKLRVDGSTGFSTIKIVCVVAGFALVVVLLLVWKLKKKCGSKVKVVD